MRPSLPRQPIRVVVLGPSRQAVSGVSTHVDLLLGSDGAARGLRLEHFQVGREGRLEGPLKRLLRLAASPFRLAARLARSRGAILHVNTSMDYRSYWRDIVYVAAARLVGARVVYQVHGGSLPLEFMRAQPLRRVLRRTLYWPDAVLVLTRAEAKAYRAFVPGQRVVLVPNGVRAPSLAVRRACGPEERLLRLLYLGRIDARKGVFDCVEAVSLARAAGVNVALTVAGSGPCQAALRQRADELGLYEVVRFAGPLFGPAKLELLARSDVLLLPTYHREGMPYALLEAMAAGVVPVVTAVAGIPDVVTDGVHGLLVPPRDPGAIARAIALLHQNRWTLRKMSGACVRRIEGRFSAARMVADLNALYGLLSPAAKAGMPIAVRPAWHEQDAAAKPSPSPSSRTASM